MTRKVLPRWMLALAGFVPVAGWASPTVTGLELVNEVRIGRTLFDLTYRITVENDATSRSGVTATLARAGLGTAIVDGVSLVGDLAANAAVTPTDTITVRHDRRFAFDRSALAWQFSETTEPPAEWSGVREDGAAIPSRDTAFAVATDMDGNVIIAGKSDGRLDGAIAFGLPDPFVAKYSTNGERLWLKSVLDVRTALGTTDSAYGVATDRDGNIYVTGDTVDTLPGETKAGGRDAFIAKYDPEGNRVWAHMLGSVADDTARGIAVDADGNAYIVGNTGGGELPSQPPMLGELFIAKFDTDGNRLWIRQWGTGGDGANRDLGRGVALDAEGNAYMAGYLFRVMRPGALGGDPVVSKFDSSGNQLWVTQLPGQGPDQANAIAVSRDGATVYLTGRTNSNFDLPGFPMQPIFCCGTPDAFVARLDGDGDLLWVQNVSSPPSGTTNFDDEGFGVATDANGSAAFVAGKTFGTMPGATSKGFYDMFVARFESEGTRTWVRQFGASLPSTSSGSGNLWDHAYAITMDPAGDLFVAGDSIGTFGGTPGGDIDRTDWIVLKLNADDGSLY